ncbi:hypothetical protein [Micromonospora zingiberis]|uniref:hypothetical protein n=1 Tax=Micromonospora zingiberis TaxID=2053011 RepID=UPI001F11517B|nr:hypothetical protein [Micromonospora zingiberis]
MLAAAGALPVPPPEELLDDPPAEPDDGVLAGVDVELDDDESDPLDLLVVLLDVLSEPEERESVR